MTDDEVQYDKIEDYLFLAMDSIMKASEFDYDDSRSQPFVYPISNTLIYSYDFGDGWTFKITQVDAKELLDKGRVNADDIKNAVKQVFTKARPYLLAADGLPLIDDVGGIGGYLDFLKGRGMYEDKEFGLEWAKGQGWKRKIPEGKNFF